MKSFLRYTAFLVILLSLFSCGTIKPIPVQTETIYNYRDSLVIKDSVRVVDLPVERIIDIKPIYDTLELETSLAASKTWLDTTFHMLRGEIQNKPQANIQTPYEEHIVYRDSIVTQEVPVEVEKIAKTHFGYEKYLWIWTILSVLGIAAYIFIKIKGFPLIRK